MGTGYHLPVPSILSKLVTWLIISYLYISVQPLFFKGSQLLNSAVIWEGESLKGKAVGRYPLAAGKRPQSECSIHNAVRRATNSIRWLLYKASLLPPGIALHHGPAVAAVSSSAARTSLNW